MTGESARAARRSGSDSVHRHASADNRRAANAAGVPRKRTALTLPPEGTVTDGASDVPREESKPSNLGTLGDGRALGQGLRREDPQFVDGVVDLGAKALERRPFLGSTSRSLASVGESAGPRGAAARDKRVL
jgi:hypothetical protein